MRGCFFSVILAVFSGDPGFSLSATLFVRNYLGQNPGFPIKNVGNDRRREEVLQMPLPSLTPALSQRERVKSAMRHVPVSEQGWLGDRRKDK